MAKQEIFTEPTLVLNRSTAENNIKRFSTLAKESGLKFRPHFKTHQSKEIGNWFRDHEIDGITVSSLKMAEYFAESGWNSITIAFPVNVLQAEKINDLASKIDLRILTVDEDSLSQLKTDLSKEIGIYIEIDPGYGRSGVHYSDHIKISNLLEKIHSSNGFKVCGFYIHAGHTYKARGKDEILDTAKPVLTIISELKTKYDLPVCFGDTPSCSVLEDFGAIDEISPGNFVFYDWIQTKIGSCKFEDIAVAMYCPVVAKYEDRNELLIHGGAVHFSKDFDLTDDGVPYYGVVCEPNSEGWSKPLSGCYLKSISQEHGIISCSKQFFDGISSGDNVFIIPIHSCLTADLMGGYTTTEGKKIDHLSKNYK